MASDDRLKGADIPFVPYDVKHAFMRIEDELIASMMRNLGRHLKEEEDEGFDWSQWQVEQLKYLQEYRRRNREEYGPRFKSINEKMEEAILHAHQNGQKEEELNILNAISKDKEIRPRYQNPDQPSIEAAGDAFFRVNDRKLEALVQATHSDMEKAEQAVLRRVDDQYRKIIFDAQMYANTGAGTVEKAVDMATKDFLAKGIDSIEYKNGSRHTISDYADMYIRTAERRAYLMGEGKMRQEWGEQLVIVNRRGTMTAGNYGHACPKCIPWLGKILIDDVYSGGKPDGKHELLSDAMAAGFLHPRCRDGFTTYFPGISPQEDPVTKKEVKEAVEAEKEESQLQYSERQQKKYERLAEYSFDEENKRLYDAKAEQWKEQADEIDVGGILDSLRRSQRVPVDNQKVVSFREMDDNDRKLFQKGLRKANPLVQSILKQQFPDVDYVFNAIKSRCIHEPGKVPIVCLAKGFTPDTVAHELFHSLDLNGAISSALEAPLLNDWIDLQNKATAYGGVVNYLQTVFPEAFETGTIHPDTKVKEKYRGISDMLEGLSGRSIQLGYGHGIQYWLKPGRVEKEAWAQFGRVYYNNDPEVMKMFSALFPSFESNAIFELGRI